MMDSPDQTDLPLLPLRKTVAFPHATSPFSIQRERSIRAIEWLSGDDAPKLLVLALQREAEEEDPALDGVHPVGTLARVLHVSAVRRDTPGYIVLATGLRRVRLVAELAQEPFLRVRIDRLDDVVPPDDDSEFVALRDSVKKLFTSVIERTPNISDDVIAVMRDVEDPRLLTDLVATAAPVDTSLRQTLLETLDVRQRMQILAEELVKQDERLGLEEKIQSDIRERVAGTQREFLLREQLKAIEKELGQGPEEGGGLQDLWAAVEEAGMPEEARKEAQRELSRLKRVPEASPEYAVVPPKKRSSTSPGDTWSRSRCARTASRRIRSPSPTRRSARSRATHARGRRARAGARDRRLVPQTRLAAGDVAAGLPDARCSAELGPPRHRIETEIELRTRRPGVAVGLAWTPTGGDVLFVEASTIAGGQGSFTLTGQLGDVMQESAKAAFTWVRAHARGLGLDPEELGKRDIHIHVPAGGVPKDGPSAGIVIVTALVSALTGKTARPDVALTGEITLSGDVLPVGGVREKVLAAAACARWSCRR